MTPIARPKKAEEAKRAFKQNVYLNESEYDELLAAAALRQMEKSKAIREAIRHWLLQSPMVQTPAGGIQGYRCDAGHLFWLQQHNVPKSCPCCGTTDIRPLKEEG